MEWENKSLPTSAIDMFHALQSNILAKPILIQNEPFHKLDAINISNTNGSNKADNLLKHNAQNLEENKNTEPKRKSGFQIINVQDLDGDESADDYDRGGGSFPHANPYPNENETKQLQSSVNYPIATSDVDTDQNTSTTAVSRQQSAVPPANQQSVCKSNIASQLPQNKAVTSCTHSISETNSVVKSRSSTSTPSKTGASRVYKVVKRESVLPAVREVARWTYCDHSDGQTPNFFFVQYENVTIHRESHPYSTSSNSSNTALNSISGSSISSHHADNQKYTQASKLASSDAAMSKKVASDDGPISETSSSDQDIFKPAAYHPDTTNNVEPDEDSVTSPNYRIDNKIEAAMDLVKKHLMLAVRDEVNELKDRISFLESELKNWMQENEAMKGLLTPEQISLLQPAFNKSFRRKSSIILYTRNQQQVCSSQAADSLQSQVTVDQTNGSSVSLQHTYAASSRLPSASQQSHSATRPTLQSQSSYTQHQQATFRLQSTSASRNQLEQQGNRTGFHQMKPQQAYSEIQLPIKSSQTSVGSKPLQIPNTVNQKHLNRTAQQNMSKSPPIQMDKNTVSVHREATSGSVPTYTFQPMTNLSPVTSPTYSHLSGHQSSSSGQTQSYNYVNS